MSWKSLLAIFIAVGIIALLMKTEVGDRYTRFLSAKVADILSRVLRLEEGESFRILLETEKAAFYGQSYAVSNITLRVAGICKSSVVVGSTVMPIDGKRCSIEAQNAQGEFDYTAGGSVKLVGKADALIVDGYPFLSTGKAFEISFEVIPVDEFTLMGISQNKITLSAVSGSIQGWKGDTQLSIDNLSNERLVISNFNGDMKLNGNYIMLVGIATSVKGENFSW